MRQNNNSNNNNNNHNNSIQPTSLFQGAPLTKFLGGTTSLTYLLVTQGGGWTEWMAFDSTRLTTTSNNHVAEPHRYWTSKLTFGSTSEFVVGTLLLLYLSRKFEREMGSRKLLHFTGWVTLGAVAVERTCLVGGGSPLTLYDNLHYLGPYALIGALFSLYHVTTPRLHPRFFSLWGLHFSEKIFHYLWLAQVAGSNGWDSATAVATGWIVALVWDVVPDAVRKVDLIPNWLAKLAGRVSAQVLESPPRWLAPPRAPTPRPPAPARGAPPPNRGAVAQRPAADPAAVEQLTNMGFSRAQVVEALQSTNNDVQRAANQLLMMAG
mmetsp:Transcript_20605/g.56885  ORF Transcript_20605/g.56885 Transcript_20605/m.56885 type:complete len:322 (+) Transcript_20605:79-1044(+)|eukprot:CAMPEP_0168729980 /NCGR_PEP_ID=MMETSP0724-20121128/6495_1 /TAXON_ID=265536 /ORGANISM="Amphiprora sp., Strain CCMP467" /LENGTH=321 /DNA_ID=CAMNT_0008776905 /DNA_START=24 /DNA_END=989 /DNA_ORIENTATION=+